MARSRLQAVGEEEVPELIGTTEEVPRPALPPPRQPAGERAFTNLLLMSLKALSQRTVVALAALVDLMLLASVFVVALLIIGNPTTAQLILAAGYACFAIGALLLRRGGPHG